MPEKDWKAWREELNRRTVELQKKRREEIERLKAERIANESATERVQRIMEEEKKRIEAEKRKAMLDAFSKAARECVAPRAHLEEDIPGCIMSAINEIFNAFEEEGKGDV